MELNISDHIWRSIASKIISQITGEINYKVEERL